MNIPKKTISLFLSFILIAGTITAFYPSLPITEAHALSDYENMMNYDNYKSTKYSSLKKDNIKCNNLNFDLNALDVDAIPEPLRNLLTVDQAQAAEEGTEIGSGTFYGNDGKERFGYNDKDFTFVCKNNSNNELIVSPTLPTPPTPPAVNNVCTVWEDDTPGNNDIFFATSTDGGLTFSEPENISENAGDSFEPQISSEVNNVYVVWTDMAVKGSHLQDYSKHKKNITSIFLLCNIIFYQLSTNNM